MGEKIMISAIFGFLIGIIACNSNTLKQHVNEGYLSGTEDAELYYQVIKSRFILVTKADKGVLSDNPEFVLPSIKEFFARSKNKLERVRIKVTRLNKSNGTGFSCMENTNRRQFDFWVGKWDVYVKGEKVAESHIERTLDGCMIMENYKNLKNDYAGKSMNFYDAKKEQWIQIWTDTQGNVSRYNGELKDGKMYFWGINNRRDGSQTDVRMEFIPNPGGSVQQIYEQSTDGGAILENPLQRYLPPSTGIINQNRCNCPFSGRRKCSTDRGFRFLLNPSFFV